MSRTHFRVVFATLFSWFFVPTVAHAAILEDIRNSIVLFTHGTYVYELAKIQRSPDIPPPRPDVKRRVMDLEPEQLETLSAQEVSVGFIWKFDGMFYLDLWTWDGEYCVIEKQNYHPITPEQAAYLTGKEYPPAKPLRYRIPRGLTLLLILSTLFFIRLATLPTPTDDEPKPTNDQAKPTSDQAKPTAKPVNQKPSALPNASA